VKDKYARQSDLAKFASEIGSRLRAARNTSGLAQRQASVAAGLSPTALGRMESGDHVPSTLSLARVAKLYGIPVGEFIPAVPE